MWTNQLRNYVIINLMHCHLLYFHLPAHIIHTIHTNSIIAFGEMPLHGTFFRSSGDCFHFVRVVCHFARELTHSYPTVASHCLLLYGFALEAFIFICVRFH